MFEILGADMNEKQNSAKGSTPQVETQQEVVEIDLDELHEHPNQKAIYGDEILDPEFIESIGQYGVLTPLIITPRPEGGYYILSGHRRAEAARRNQFATVPAIIRTGLSPLDFEVQHIELNRMRHKTTRQKILEFLTLKQKLCQPLQLIDDNGLGVDQNSIFGALLTNVNRTGENSLNLEELIEDNDEPKRICDIIKEKTGLNYYFQKNATVVFDDIYIGEKFERFRKFGVPERVLNEFWNFLVETRRKTEAGEILLHNAAEKVKERLKEIEAKYRKEEKKPSEAKGKAKQKEEFARKERNEGKERSSEAKEESWKFEPSKLLIPIEAKDTKQYVFFKRDGVEIGILGRTLPDTKEEMRAMYVRKRDKFFEISVDYIFEIIERLYRRRK